jgi:integrase
VTCQQSCSHCFFISEKEAVKDNESLGYKGRMTEDAVRKFVERYSNGKLTPHMFRKGLGTLMYNLTGDIHMVAKQLGDLDSTVAKYYASLDRERRADVMNSL